LRCHHDGANTGSALCQKRYTSGKNGTSQLSGHTLYISKIHPSRAWTRFFGVDNLESLPKQKKIANHIANIERLQKYFSFQKNVDKNSAFKVFYIVSLNCLKMLLLRKTPISSHNFVNLKTCSFDERNEHKLYNKYLKNTFYVKQRTGRLVIHFFSSKK